MGLDRQQIAMERGAIQRHDDELAAVAVAALFVFHIDGGIGQRDHMAVFDADREVLKLGQSIYACHRGFDDLGVTVAAVFDRGVPLKRSNYRTAAHLGGPILPLITRDSAVWEESGDPVLPARAPALMDSMAAAHRADDDEAEGDESEQARETMEIR